MSSFYCYDCGSRVNHDPMVARLWCDCLVMTEEAVVAATPSRWQPVGFWQYMPSNPQPPGPPAKYPDKCSGCGKDMETMGLNRSYPPKQDGNGAWICPHCGYLHLGGSISGTVTWHYDARGLLVDQADCDNRGGNCWGCTHPGMPLIDGRNPPVRPPHGGSASGKITLDMYSNQIVNLGSIGWCDNNDPY